MPRTWRAVACSAACLIGLLVPVAQADAIRLVTEQEAALPPDQTPPLLSFDGSPLRRPSVTIVSPPANGGVMKSPLALKVNLEAHGGAKIDPDGLNSGQPILPETRVEWRDNIVYAASVALSFVAGHAVIPVGMALRRKIRKI
jgi:hypothetical protein